MSSEGIKGIRTAEAFFGYLEIFSVTQMRCCEKEVNKSEFLISRQ